MILISQVITEELGMNLEKVDLSMFGNCKKVCLAQFPLACSPFPFISYGFCICEQITVSKDDTVFLDGAGDKKSISERCEQVGLHFSYVLSCRRVRDIP